MAQVIDTAFLREAAAAAGVDMDEQTAARFETYARVLLEWNEKMNLTAITDPTDIVIKHFVDSLMVLKYLPPEPFSLIDVGTGAGFPGVPLAIMRPDCKLTLLDSLQKRLTFLQAACAAVGVNATFCHARAEEGGQKPKLREQFDIATARAVGKLPLLCEYCLPYVKVGGAFLALKGQEGAEDAGAAARVAGILGGKMQPPQTFTLPADKNGECATRQVVVFGKVKNTAPQYPRSTKKIAKGTL